MTFAFTTARAKIAANRTASRIVAIRFTAALPVFATVRNGMLCRRLFTRNLNRDGEHGQRRATDSNLCHRSGRWTAHLRRPSSRRYAPLRRAPWSSQSRRGLQALRADGRRIYLLGAGDPAIRTAGAARDTHAGISPPR